MTDFNQSIISLDCVHSKYSIVLIKLGSRYEIYFKVYSYKNKTKQNVNNYTTETKPLNLD